MDVSLYDFDKDLVRVKKKISEMKTDGRNIELLLDFAEDCLAGWKVPKKTLINSIPDTLPQTGSLPLRFPTVVKLFDLFTYSKHIMDALNDEIKNCEIRKEFSVSDISFAEHDIKEFPCAKKLLANGRTSGRYYGVQSIVLIARMCGASWAVASKKARDFLNKCDGLTEADKTLRIENVKSLFETTGYHFSCRVLKETLGDEYCSFKTCPIRKKYASPKSESSPFFYDDSGVNRRVIKNYKDGSEDVSTRRICNNPVWLTHIGNNIDDSTVWCEVTFKDALKQEKAEWVSMKTLLSKDVIELTKNGLKFTESAKEDMNDYFLWAHKQAQTQPFKIPLACASFQGRPLLLPGAGILISTITSYEIFQVKFLIIEAQIIFLSKTDLKILENIKPA